MVGDSDFDFDDVACDFDVNVNVVNVNSDFGANRSFRLDYSIVVVIFS